MPLASRVVDLILEDFEPRSAHQRDIRLGTMRAPPHRGPAELLLAFPGRPGHRDQQHATGFEEGCERPEGAAVGLSGRVEDRIERDDGVDVVVTGAEAEEVGHVVSSFGYVSAGEVDLSLRHIDSPHVMAALDEVRVDRRACAAADIEDPSTLGQMAQQPIQRDARCPAVSVFEVSIGNSVVPSANDSGMIMSSLHETTIPQPAPAGTLNR